MALHDCPYSFHELANDVLPRMMAQLQKRLDSPLDAAGSILGKSAVIPKSRGVYVWLVEGKPIYVGITHNLSRRLKDHLQGDSSRANLAVRLAAQQLDFPIARVKQHPEFDATFAKAKAHLAEGAIAYLEVDNPLVLYIFEPYCAMALDTKAFNRFDTFQILTPKSPKRSTPTNPQKINRDEHCIQKTPARHQSALL